MNWSCVTLGSSVWGQEGRARGRRRQGEARFCHQPDRRIAFFHFHCDHNDADVFHLPDCFKLMGCHLMHHLWEHYVLGGIHCGYLAEGRWWTTHTMDPTQSSPLFLSKLLFLGTASLHMGGPWQYWRLSPWYRSPLIVADGPPIKLEPRQPSGDHSRKVDIGCWWLSVISHVWVLTLPYCKEWVTSPGSGHLTERSTKACC